MGKDPGKSSSNKIISELTQQDGRGKKTVANLVWQAWQ